MTDAQEFPLVRRLNAAFNDTFIAKMQEQAGPDFNVRAQWASAMSCISADKYLAKCDLASVAMAIYEASRLRLSLHPALAQGDLIARRRGDGYLCSFEPRYGGLIELARRSGLITGIVAEVVYTNDLFEVDLANQTISHKPRLTGDRGVPLCVYARVWFLNGGDEFRLMRIDEVNKIRDNSEGYKAYQQKKIQSTPWVDWWDEMARKTVLKRMSKQMPKSETFQALHEAVGIDNALEGGPAVVSQVSAEVVNAALADSEPSFEEDEQERALEGAFQQA